MPLFAPLQSYIVAVYQIINKSMSINEYKSQLLRARFNASCVYDEATERIEQIEQRKNTSKKSTRLTKKSNIDMKRRRRTSQMRKHEEQKKDEEERKKKEKEREERKEKQKKKEEEQKEKKKLKRKKEKKEKEQLCEDLHTAEQRTLLMFELEEYFEEHQSYSGVEDSILLLSTKKLPEAEKRTTKTMPSDWLNFQTAQPQSVQTRRFPGSTEAHKNSSIKKIMNKRLYKFGNITLSRVY